MGEEIKGEMLTILCFDGVDEESCELDEKYIIRWDTWIELIESIYQKIYRE